MAELVDAADSKSVFERSGSSILPRGTKHRFKVPLNAPWIHRETGHRAGFFVSIICCGYHAVALLQSERYPFVIAANSANGFGRPTSKRRTGAP